MKRALSLSHYYLRDYIQRNAVGKSAAIPLPDVAAALGITTRRVQELKADLLDVAGIIICSSCGATPGLYWPTTVEDVRPYHTQQGNREAGSRRARQAMERRFPQLREQHLRTPPRTIRTIGKALDAQGLLFEDVPA